MSAPQVSAQTLKFKDGTPQWEVGMQATSDSTRYVTPNSDVTMENFMSRPVLIGTSAWTPGLSPYTLTLDPWTSFFSNKRVINRINNYKIMNCKLKLKFIVNGNPFYFGRLMVDYLPLPTYDKITAFSTLDPFNAIAASQRLHGFVNPTTSQGLTMELPFIWPTNGFDLTVEAFSLLGRIYVRELVALKHANGSTDPISISVFAWVEDLSLSIPTTQPATGLVQQASEIDMTPSSLMSAASNLSSKLTNVPIIGKYAMATSMVTKGLGEIAKFFGYSRPVIIDPIPPMRPTFIGDLACVDKKEAIYRLSADSRQELTIDPSVIGVTLPDELDIKYIVGKESYLTTFPWTVDTAPEDLLFNVRVSPALYAYDAPYWHMTAPCFASLPFTYWRGTMKFRFQIVCSQYHKGRLLFVYDPDKVTGLETNVVYSRIIDLENEHDFTMDVAWSQPTTFLPVTGLSSTEHFGVTEFVTTDATKNGVLGVYVLNELTSPNSAVDNDISINVFVSMCDDAEFAVPDGSVINALTYSTQSEEVEMDSAPTNMEPADCMSECVTQNDTALVYFGERFVSFRSLLKRYNYLNTIVSPLGPTSTQVSYLWRIVKSDFPPMRGQVVSGGLNNTGTANYTATTLLNYLAPAFLATRGSTRHKLVYKQDASTNSNTCVLSVTRGVGTSPSNQLTARDITTSDAHALQMADATIRTNSLNAMAVTILPLQPILEYEVPYYRNYRFDVTKDPFGVGDYSPINASFHLLGVDNLRINNATIGSIDTYVSVGEDFQLLLYQGPPLVKEAIFL